MTLHAQPGMAPPRTRGFTLFELAVSVIIIGLLSSLLLVRLHSYQRDAREVAVQRLVGTLRTALSVKSSQLSVAKREHELRQIIDENPMSWLVETPANYLGEYYSPEGDALPDDSWYFDRGQKELVYIESKGKSFPMQKLTLLRFKVKFIEPNLQMGTVSGLPAGNMGVILDQVTEKNVVN